MLLTRAYAGGRQKAKPFKQLFKGLCNKGWGLLTHHPQYFIRVEVANTILLAVNDLIVSGNAAMERFLCNAIVCCWINAYFTSTHHCPSFYHHTIANHSSIHEVII